MERDAIAIIKPKFYRHNQSGRLMMVISKRSSSGKSNMLHSITFDNMGEVIECDKFEPSDSFDVENVELKLEQVVVGMSQFSFFKLMLWVIGFMGRA